MDDIHELDCGGSVSYTQLPYTEALLAAAPRPDPLARRPHVAVKGDAGWPPRHA
jgi:hypothetical protein